MTQDALEPDVLDPDAGASPSTRFTQDALNPDALDPDALYPGRA